MSSAAQSAAAQPRVGAELTLVFLWNACGTVLLVLFPPTAPALLPLCAIVPLVWYWSVHGRLPWSKPSPVMVAMALVGAYLLLNASWSLSPYAAFRTVGLFWAITGILYVSLNVLERIDRAVLRAMAMGLIAGMAVGGAVLCVETFTGQGIRRMLIAILPALQPEARHTVVLEDGTAVFRAYLLNRSITEFTLLFWPVAMAIERLGLSKWKMACMLAALAPGTAAIVRSEHATSKIAFAGALILYVLFRLYPVVAKRLVVASWVATIVLVVPLVSLAFSQQLYRAGWLAPSAQHRVVIWGYTSEQIGKSLLLGSGIATARAVNEMERSVAKPAPGTTFHLSTSLHSHNAYLQTWYETGAVGALLLLGLGLFILRSVAHSEAWAQVYLYSTFAASALLAATSFSIWAPWLMSSFVIVTIAAAVGSTPAVPATAVRATS